MSDIEPIQHAVNRERHEHDIALACEAEGHAYFTDTGDPIHGVCGTCACGSRLYSITGEELE